MTLTARSGFLRVMAARASSSSSGAARSSTTSMSVDAGVDAARYTNFIKEKVRATRATEMWMDGEGNGVL